MPLRSGTIQRCPLSPLLFNIVLEVLARAVRQEKEIKVIQIRKEEVELSLFADDMVLYVQSPKGSTKKLLEIINKYSKGYKISIQKSVPFLYANSGLAERDINKNNPIYSLNKRQKKPRNQFNQEGEKTYTENYKTLLK